MNFQPKKRQLMAVGAASLATAGGILLPQDADADPIIGAALIALFGTLYAAVMNMASVNKQAEDTALSAARNWQYSRVDALINTLPVNEQVALLQNRSFVQMIVSGNLDKLGTFFEMQDGKITVARNGIGGQLSTNEATVNSNVIYPNRGSIAIPVEYYQPIEGQKEKDKIIEYVADSKGVNTSDFKDQYKVSQTRRYSNTRYPSKSNADLKMIVAINRKQTKGKYGDAEIFTMPANV